MYSQLRQVGHLASAGSKGRIRSAAAAVSVADDVFPPKITGPATAVLPALAAALAAVLLPSQDGLTPVLNSCDGGNWKAGTFAGAPAAAVVPGAGGGCPKDAKAPNGGTANHYHDAQD